MAVDTPVAWLPKALTTALRTCWQEARASAGDVVHREPPTAPLAGPRKPTKNKETPRENLDKFKKIIQNTSILMLRYCA